jgi:hypothetical protein
MKPDEDKLAAGNGDSRGMNGDSNGTTGWPPDWGPQYRFTPEELDAFRQEVSEEELMALLAEIKETGGVSSAEMLEAIERAANGDD